MRIKADRNKSYECFSPVPSQVVHTAIFAPSKVLRDLQERSVALKRGDIVSHILLTGSSDGLLRVYYNCHERVG